MLYGELGVTPISLQIKSRIINYWCKLLNGKDDKICNILYKTAYSVNVIYRT
jgi:3-oxoacyl-[acyl-carrier-protein] synthase III